MEKKYEFVKLNTEPILIETVPDEHEEANDYRPSFWWNNRRYFVEDFAPTHDNPWAGCTEYPEYIHRYEKDNYRNPLYIELLSDEALNVYEEREAVHEAPDSRPELVLLEKEGACGLTADETGKLFAMLGEGVEAYPIEIEARNVECSAMGFISAEGAEKIEYDYDRSGLRDFVSGILDDMEKENESHEYTFCGIRIWMGY